MSQPSALGRLEAVPIAASRTHGIIEDQALLGLLFILQDYQEGRSGDELYGTEAEVEAEPTPIA